MTVEVLENFDSVQSVDDLGAMYNPTGAGLTNEANVEIKTAAGPTFMAGQPQSPRNPPSTIHFKGTDSSTGSNYVILDIYDETKSFGSIQSQYKSVAMNWKPVSGQRNSQGFGDTVAVFLSFYAYLATTTSLVSLRVNHSLELFDPPDNGFPGGGVGLSIYENETGNSGDLLWDSLSDSDEATATEAGLYWAAGQQNGAFFEYGTWYHLEIRVFCNGSGSSVEFRVNGVVVYKNDNASLISSQRIELIELRAGDADGTFFFGSGFEYEATDIVVQDWSTGFTGFTFPAVVDTVKVTTEVVGEQDFTPQTGTDNAAMVDEVPHDYDTTYNESNTATDKDRFSTTQEVPYTSVNGDVYAVKVQALMKDTLNTGTRTARVVAFENVTEGQGPTVTLTESGYQAVWGVFEDNPDTTALWTKAEVNGSEIGYEIVS